MASGDERDVERDRAHDLIGRLRLGAIDDAEREELALYAEDHPDVAEAVERAEKERELGEGWLVRAEADREIEEAERTPFVTAERRVGAALAVGGAVGFLFAPPLGAVALAGLGILGFSHLRTYIRAAIKDPYKEVKK